MEDFIRNRRTNEREAAYAAIGAIKTGLVNEVFNDGGDFERMRAVIRVIKDANVPEVTDDIRAIEGVITVKQVKPIEDASGGRSIAILTIKYDKTFADDPDCVSLYDKIKELSGVDMVVLKDSSERDISLLGKEAAEKENKSQDIKQEGKNRRTLLEIFLR